MCINETCVIMCINETQWWLMTVVWSQWSELFLLLISLGTMSTSPLTATLIISNAIALVRFCWLSNELRIPCNIRVTLFIQKDAGVHWQNYCRFIYVVPLTIKQQYGCFSPADLLSPATLVTHQWQSLSKCACSTDIGKEASRIVNPTSSSATYITNPFAT